MNFNRKFLLITLAAIFFAGLGLRLGFWQLDRAAQKEALQAAMAEQSLQAPLDTTAVAQLPGLDEGLYRVVKVSGTWEVAHSIYLDNRQMDGKVGFFVLTPLRLQPSGVVVMVQRGWVARNFETRATVPKVQTPSGPVSLEGQIAPLPAKRHLVTTEVEARTYPAKSRLGAVSRAKRPGAGAIYDSPNGSPQRRLAPRLA